MAGREALTTGLIKRVGDGSSISIWNDKWIPSTATMVPLASPTNTFVSLVSDLIDPSTWSWRRELIRDMFLPSDAQAILNIPLRSGGGDDFLAWANEASGNYTVKSAYRALVTRNELQAPEEGQATSSIIDNQQLWNSLWKLNVLPKVRVFFWRVLRGILPDECTLIHRRIGQQNLCKLCMANEEDLEHALLRCAHAASFWEEVEQLFDFQMPILQPITWAKDIICGEQFTSRDRAILVSVMWSIWHSRNRLTHGEDKLDPAMSVHRTRETLALLDIPRRHALVMLGHGWRPPEPGFVTINTNAGIKCEDGKGGVGGVARSLDSFLGGME